jgi:hypothetical protein
MEVCSASGEKHIDLREDPQLGKRFSQTGTISWIEDECDDVVGRKKNRRGEARRIGAHDSAVAALTSGAYSEFSAASSNVALSAIIF